MPKVIRHFTNRPRREFQTGAFRDTNGDKPNMLSYTDPEVEWRYALYMKESEKRYGRANWKKGLPKYEYLESLRRHFTKIWLREEKGIDLEPEVDHEAAVMFNIIGFMREQMKEKYEKENQSHHA